jgi:hypothetical protein
MTSIGPWRAFGRVSVFDQAVHRPWVTGPPRLIRC